MMKLISWNCRGLGSNHKKSLLRSLIRSESPLVLLLQETKLQDSVALQDAQFFWRTGTGVAVSSRGASGGICTLWNPHFFHLLDWSCSSNWIQVTLTHLPSGKSFSIYNIYMPSVYHDKIQCWNSLFSLQDQANSVPYIFVGDFNTTLHALEKRGGTIVRDSTREHMEELISDLDLVDIKPTSGRFTWSNKRHGPGHIVVRLDRFLISGCLLEDQFLPSSCILPWSGFDHRPISLSLPPPH
jgi:exonuclease III